MVKKVADFVAEHKMLEEQDKVVVGISGGADSVCLLLMLLELKKTLSFEVIGVHVNHGLRGEAALHDEQYVKRLCEKYQIPLEIYCEDVELFAKNRKQSLEEAGRNVRRNAFQKTLVKYHANKIALAHHKNDNAETVLMNLARGSGLAGLSGIRPVSGNMIRPLLCLMRQEIESYLKEKGVEFCTDLTNASDEYTRNRIRNHLIPFVEQEVNEQAVTHIADTADQMRKIFEYMEQETEQYFYKAVTEDEKGLVIRKEIFDAIPEIFQDALLKKVLGTASKKEQDLHRIHVKCLRELMQKQVGRKTNLPYGLLGERCYEGIRICKKEKSKKIVVSEKNLLLNQEERIGELSIFCEIVETGDWEEEKVYTKYFDYDIIKRTITLRTRKTGDYITINEKGDTQKLKSFFINAKIPQEERDQVLLLAEGSHVLWVIGYRRGCAYYVPPNANKIIKISINKGETKNGREY